MGEECHNYTVMKATTTYMIAKTTTIMMKRAANA